MTETTPSASSATSLVSKEVFTPDLSGLRGSRCLDCGELGFPVRQLCPTCGSPQINDVTLPRHGTVWTFTVLHARPPGYEGPCPYALGVVELAEELRITTLITADELSDLRIGDAVVFEPVTIGSPEAPVTTFAYRRQEPSG